MYEVMWDTRPFNDKSLWPETGQPLVYSTGDAYVSPRNLLATSFIIKG